jgi:hypothetical protein
MSFGDAVGIYQDGASGKEQNKNQKTELKKHENRINQ